jgi:hypothetical protein
MQPTTHMPATTSISITVHLLYVQLAQLAADRPHHVT